MHLNDSAFFRERAELARALARAYDLRLPDLEETVEILRGLSGPSVRDVLAGPGPVRVQPRCGVSDHGAMRRLLGQLAHADLLTVTIDSYTRLLQLDRANGPGLNGYPLITHGVGRGRDLAHSVRGPVQVRHGSPDGRALAEFAYASSFTAFEGGGISYNLPYAADAPLRDTLAAYRYVDRLTGLLTERTGLLLDRETFGSLTGVLVPPAIAIAVSLLEVLLAVEQGVRCVTVSVPETGCLAQDVAALRIIPGLVREYLGRAGLPGPPVVEVYTAFHQWMGVFPADPQVAEEVIAYGVIAAAAGGATKLINKTSQEARGVPTAGANARAIRCCQRLAGYLNAHPDVLAALRRSADVAEEEDRTRQEVHELLDGVLPGAGGDLARAVEEAFSRGRLDIPFPASRSARGAVIPARDRRGAIRILRPGDLPFSTATLARHRADVGTTFSYRRILDDITYVARGASLDDDPRRRLLAAFREGE
jgi:methylaspartate mutase epsilon subunit